MTTNSASAPGGRRSRYWGLHFDFHATLSDRELGKGLTRRMIGTILNATGPDYIQCDCKGHPGIASYRTEVGVPAAEFTTDPLRLWREVTAERGVALLGHFSGVWDFEAVKRQPEWARMDAEGKPSIEATSTFGSYAEQRMIPQLKELSDRYGLDGVWIDGDCWAVAHDYSEAAVAAFREAYGYAGPMPQAPGDAMLGEWTEFNRESFRAYVRKVADELHRHRPEFQVASNWAFSSFMPEPVTADVDFLSGDLLPNNSVNSARLEARVLAAQGRPWDVMSWSFNKIPGQSLYSTKSAVQLKQEAAVVIALGGGFQVYLKQRRDASVHMWPIDTIGDVGRFCRERQPWCEGTERLPQVGLLLSRRALYESGERVFGSWGERLDDLQGALHALLDCRQPVDIVMEHTPPERMADYPLIVVPGWRLIEEDCRKRLLDYARGGGRLLLLGPDAVGLFAADPGFPASGPSGPACPASERPGSGISPSGRSGSGVMWLLHEGKMAGLETPFVSPADGGRCETFGNLYKENDPIGEPLPAASIFPYGAGTVGCVWFEFGKPYLHKRTSVQRDFLGGLAKRMMPEPEAEVAGSCSVDVVCARKDGRMIVHLINTSGPHADPNVCVFDELPPIGPLQVKLRAGKPPIRVSLQPSDAEIPFEYGNGMLVVSGIRVDVHAILVAEFAP